MRIAGSLDRATKPDPPAVLATPARDRARGVGPFRAYAIGSGAFCRRGTPSAHCAAGRLGDLGRTAEVTGRSTGSPTDAQLRRGGDDFAALAPRPVPVGPRPRIDAQDRPRGASASNETAHDRLE